MLGAAFVVTGWGVMMAMAGAVEVDAVDWDDSVGIGVLLRRQRLVADRQPWRDRMSQKWLLCPGI